MMTTFLAMMQIVSLVNGYSTTELTERTRTLEDHVIYEVTRNVTIPEGSLHVDSGKTGVIYIHEGCTLIVKAAPQRAAIHVPAGAKLVIAGDANSFIDAQGGDATSGASGDRGGNASTTSVWKKTSYTGWGGRGGKGGFGAGAAIGGNGGNGGQAGNGGERRETVAFSTQPGRNGQPGIKGDDGEGMGAVFVSGQVSIHACKAGRISSLHDRAEAGNKDESGYWVPFSYHKMNAGGGGGGGSGGEGGLTNYGIGGGAPGGGGGGGGGSGAFDSYGGKETQGHGSSGQGGFGGENEFGYRSNQGYWDNQEVCRHSSNTWSGAGGSGGKAGKAGSDGQLFAQKANNFTINTDCRWSQIQAANYPLDLVLQFDNVLPDLPKQPDLPFYYGMTPMSKITVPTSTDPNYIFAGYYLADGTQVYTNKGELTEKGKSILYCFHNVQLSAYWIGPTHVHLTLKYEQPNPSSKEEEYVVYPIDSFYVVLPEQSKHIQWCAKDYLIKNYHTDENQCLSVDLQPSSYYADTFVYTLNRHTMTWKIPQTKGDIYKKVYLKNNLGEPVNLLQETLPTGRLVSEPRLYFQSEDDSLGIQVLGWSHKPERMPDQDVTDNELSLQQVQVKVYVAKSDSGRLVVRNRKGEEVTQCAYGDTLSIQLIPNTGCKPDRPKVCQYKEGVVGDTLPLHQVDELNYWFCCTSTVMLQCRYQPEQYTTSVWYNYDSIPATKDKAHTWFASKRLPTPVQTDSFAYHYNDQITFASWLYTDSLTNWIFTPVVRTPVGDTVPIQWTLTDLLIDPITHQHVWMPAYTFFAPASAVSITQTVYYRPRTTCTVFNHTRQTHIDSVFVNLNKVDLGEDSTTLVRTLDVVSLQVNEIDTHAVAAKAGYWDEHDQYQRLPLQVDKVETETGDFATVFSTMAPDRAMVIGLIDGPRIILQHCDTAVEWIAPSAAAVGDTVMFRLEPRHDHELVEADSVLIYDINSQLVYRFDSADAWANRFVMLDTTLYVYVYAHVKDQYHSVTFLNANGDTLQYQDWYLKGDMPAYKGNTPELASDTTKFRWVFQGWTPEIHPVAGDDVYTATYKAYLRLDMFADCDTLLKEFEKKEVDVTMRTLSITPEYYYAVSFPFDLPLRKVKQAWGEGTFVFAFTSTSMEGPTINLNFSVLTDDTLTAGTPYLLRAGSSSKRVEFDSVVIQRGADTIRQELAEYRATAVPTWLEERNYHIRFLNKNRIFWPLNCSGPLYGFGGYFYLLDDETAGPTGVCIKTDIEMNSDSREDEDGNGAADPYTGEEQEDSTTELIQRIVSEQPSGVMKVISGGQLWIIREGKVYNALGETIY